MSRLDELKKSASEVGLVVDTYSPGDGVTRYRFINASAPAYHQSYFGASSSNRVWTALGIKAAEDFLDGFWTGYRAGRVSKTQEDCSIIER